MRFRDAWDRFRRPERERGRRDDGDLEYFYGTDNRDPYAARDYGHSGGFTNSGNDFDRDTPRPSPRDHDWNSSWELDDDDDSDFDSSYPSARDRSGRQGGGTRFGANMQGSFGMDRGGEGMRGGTYFGQSDRGRHSNAAIGGREANYGGDIDRGFAAGSMSGGTDRGYSGGMNYGFGGGAYRGGMGHDRGPASSVGGRDTSHRGRGPRGFTRSDERLRELVADRLKEHDQIDASEIDVTVSNGEVTLVGTVDSRRTKRLAEDVAESVLGVRDVHNQLKIASGVGADFGVTTTSGSDRDETVADSEQKANDRL